MTDPPLSLQDLGEHDILDRLIKTRFPAPSGFVLGIGDDCAVLPLVVTSQHVVVTIDPCPTPVVCLLDGTDYYHYAGADHEAIEAGTLKPSGYRATSSKTAPDGVGFMFPDGPDVGTTVAISGAAANPNAGYHTSGPMAFLLTVFDARLGWWVGNPRKNTSKNPGPPLAWVYLFFELFGLTTGRSRYVNVSDGGHFENLGLYELVRRRCRYIIVGDAEQDEHMTFEGLGGAIRKCRADFGVEIDIDPTPIALVNSVSRAHCVVGTILYPEEDGPNQVAALYDERVARPSGGQARGWLLYLKSSVTGDEPMDIRQYRAANRDFPQQSTGDQFFSESQFESYRRLGLHIVRDAFEGIESPAPTGDPGQLRTVFQRLTRKWYGPAVARADAVGQLAGQYVALVWRLGARQPPGAFEQEMLPDLEGVTIPTGSAAPGTAELVLGLEAIQLMENVFMAFTLELPANQMNPHIAGWMTLFRRWAKSTVLYGQMWPKVKNDFNPLFQKFVEVDLQHDAPLQWPHRP